MIHVSGSGTGATGVLGGGGGGPPVDVVGSPLEVVGPPVDVVGPPVDVVGSPLEVEGPPVDVVGPPLEVVGPPVEVVGSPEDVPPVEVPPVDEPPDDPVLDSPTGAGLPGSPANSGGAGCSNETGRNPGTPANGMVRPSSAIANGVAGGSANMSGAAAVERPPRGRAR